MAKTFVQPGDVLTTPAPVGGVVSGTPKLIGNIFCIPQVTKDAGEAFAGRVTGVVTVPKAAGFTMTAWTTIAYWDVADVAVNNDTGNPAVGIAVEDAESGDTTCTILMLNPKWIDAAAASARLDAVEAEVDVLNAGQYAGQVRDYLMPADGTQVALTVDDTWVPLTDDAIEIGANDIEDNDEVEWEYLVKVDGMDAAGLVTVELRCGSLTVDTVALTTADANDWVKLKGSKRATAVGASSTWEVAGGEGCGSDGGSVTRDTPTYSGGATGPATTSAVVYTVRAKAATGNAANLVTMKKGRIRHSKAA